MSVTHVLSAWAQGRGSLGPGSQSSAEAGGICCPQASMFGLCQIRNRISVRMILHCTHGQEHVHVTSRLGVTQPQGKEQRDSSAQGSGGSPTGAGWAHHSARTGRQHWVLAGIATSSRQQESGWAGHYVAEPAQA